jgi:hypothetical protein
VKELQMDWLRSRGPERGKKRNRPMLIIAVEILLLSVVAKRTFIKR